MACHAGPKVSESGLVLALDAANSVITLSTVEVLVVAGGGAGGGYGGNDGSGGGGAGGLIYSSAVSITPGTPISVTVGDGGSGVGGATRGNNGGNSIFGSLTAIGGGGGGTEGAERVGKDGGSGGGAGGYGVKSGGAATVGQGNRGGDCTGPGDGGGGGAGLAGESGLTGKGGDGLGFGISGTFAYYAGGGGAGGDKRNTRGASGGLSGIGGGGKGQDANNSTPPQNGTTNTGGGGGGAAGSNPTYGAGTTLTSGSGGSGIVIVRYPGPQKAIGGTVTSRGGYTIHTFTSVGSTTFTPLSASSGSAISGLTDISNNGNFGTPVNGPTYSSANGGSIAFDGVDDYINTATATSLSINSASTPFTISVWFKTIGVAEYYLFDNYNGGVDISLRIDGGKFEVYMAATGAIDGVQFGSGYNNGVWHNFVLTWNGSNTINAYADAINIGFNTTTITGSFESNAAFQIGRRPAGGGGIFPGNIATTQVYNRALSAAEIQQNYNALAPRFVIPSIVTSGLVLNLDAGNTASYPGSGTTWTDVSGNGRTGTLTNGPTYSSANGGSIVFDGTNDYVVITQTLTTPFTITGFIKYTDQAKIMNMYMNTNPHTVLGISLNRTGVGDLYVFIGNGGGWIDVTVSSTNMIVNQWYQVSFTTTGSGSTLYLNGVNVGTSVYSPSGWGSTYYLGTIGFNNEELRGNIATTQIYNRALSAEEIQQNFNALRGRFNI